MNEKPRIYHFECLKDQQRDMVNAGTLAAADGWIACDVCGQPMLLVDPMENAQPGEIRVYLTEPVHEEELGTLPARTVLRQVKTDTHLLGLDLLEGGYRFFITDARIEYVGPHIYGAYFEKAGYRRTVKTVTAYNETHARETIKNLLLANKATIPIYYDWMRGGTLLKPLAILIGEDR